MSKPKTLTPAASRVLAAMQAEAGELTGCGCRWDVATAINLTGLSSSGVRSAFHRLTTLGFVAWQGDIRPETYRLTPAGRAASPRCAPLLAKGRRAKGQRGEREFAARLAALYPDAHRGAQSRSGRDGCDVEGTPWWVECKTRHGIAVFRFLEQAERDTDGRPVLVRLREDGDTRGAVLLREDVFLDLLRQAEGRI